MANLGLCLQGSAIKIQAQFSNVYRKNLLHGLDTLISKNRSRGAGISGKLFQNRNRDPVIGLGREGRRLYPGDASGHELNVLSLSNKCEWFIPWW